MNSEQANFQLETVNSEPKQLGIRVSGFANPETSIRIVALLLLVALLLGSAVTPTIAQSNVTLIAHWQMENGNANDSSGNGYDGAISGATWRDGVKAGRADGDGSFEFDGSNDFIDTAVFNSTDSFTVSAWVNPQNTTNRAILAKNVTGSSNGNQFLLGFYEGGYHVAMFGDNFEAGTLQTGWQHLIVTGEANASGTNVTLYRNGIKLWDQQFSVTINNGGTSRAWSIGQEWDGNSRSDYFDGHIDDVRIYNGAMSASEVAALTADYAISCTFSPPSIPAWVFSDPECDIINLTAGDYEINQSIGRTMLIRGAGESATFLTAKVGSNFRAINNVAGNSLTLENLTVRDGNTNSSNDGAGIANRDGAFLYLNNVTFDNNVSLRDGGAIWNLFGTLIGRNVTVTNNQAVNGAGVWTYGRTEFYDSTIANNDATYGGGGLYSEGGTLTLDGVTFSNNNGSDGGAITSYSDEAVEISGSLFEGNSADTLGGAFYTSTVLPITIEDSDFIGNSAGAEGGAINIESTATVAIENATFSNNTSQGIAGAVMNNFAHMTIRNSRIDNNTTTLSGGGIYNANGATLTVEDSWIYSNYAEATPSTNAPGGGGIFNNASTLTVRRSMLMYNRADWNGGAIYHRGSGGSVTVENSTLYYNIAGAGAGFAAFNNQNIRFRHSTIAQNYSNSSWAGGVHIYNSARAYLYSTIVANNAGASQCETNLNGAAVVSQGFNIATDGSCSLNASGDMPNTDPQLGGLTYGYEGHFRPLLPLLDGSPAQDRGNPDPASCAGTDQRGAPRFAAVTPIGACDIGAIEITEDTLRTQWHSVWQRYYDWATEDIAWLHPSLPDGGFVKTGRDFRTQALTRPDQDDITTLTDIEQNYRDDFTDGRLFWRFCTDYENVTLTPNGWQTCEPYGSDSDFGHLVNDLSEGGGNSIDIHNTLANANNHFDAIYNGSTVGAITPQQLAISGTLQTTYEMAAAFLIYGNEFYADALRHNVTTPATSGAAIIQAEIDQLNDALAMYDLASETLFLALDHEMGGTGSGDYLGRHFTPHMFQTYAVASERRAEVLIEIAQREWLLAFAPASRDDAAIQAVVERLNEAYSVQYLQAAAFAERAVATGGSNAFLANGGQQLIDNLDQLLQMAETIRTSDNPLGYDSAYMPTKPFLDLYNRIDQDILPDGYASETDAANAQRTFDQNASELLAPGGELEMLTAEIRDELATICGANNAPNYTQCVVDETQGSELQIVTQDIRIAHDAVSLAWQEATNIAEFIRIENETAQAIIDIHDDFGAATSMDAYDLALAKMDGYLQAGTTGQAAQDPYDPSGAAYWINMADTAGSCFIAGLTLGAVLADRCADNIIDPLHDAFGTGHGRIDPANEEWSPNNALAVEVQIADMQRLREAERDADITAAKSSQRIRELLIEQSDLLLAYEIEVEKMNRVIMERNGLMQRYQRLANRLSRFENDIDFNAYDPIQRVIRDHSAEAAHHDLARSIHYAYMTAKALEYALPNGADNFHTQIPYYQLYQARRVEHVDEFVTLLYDTFENIPEPTPYLAPISVARDIFGLSNSYVDGLLPYTPDPASETWPFEIAQCNGTITVRDTLRHCLFQDRLQRGITNDPQITGNANETVLYLRFSTSLDVVDPFDVLWYQKIAPVGTLDPGCTVSSGNANGCQGVAIDFKTTQNDYSGNTIIAQLTHKGVNSYRRPTNGTTPAITFFSPGRAVNLVNIIPSVFDDADGTTVAVQSSINANGHGQEYGGFEGLSSAASDWRLEVPLTGVQSELDIAQMTDIVLTMDTLAYSQSSRAMADAQAWSSLRLRELNGEDVQAQLATLETALANHAPRTTHHASTTMDDGRQTTRTTSQTVPNLYLGSFDVTAPVQLGIIDLGVTLTRTGNTVVGMLCGDCSAHLSADYPLTGNASGNTFTAQTQPFTQLIDGRTVTRTVFIDGEWTHNGDLITGTYRETVEGYLVETIEVEGELIGVRPMGDPDTSLVPTAVGLQQMVVSSAARGWLALASVIIALITTRVVLRTKSKSFYTNTEKC